MKYCGKNITILLIITVFYDVDRSPLSMTSDVVTVHISEWDAMKHTQDMETYTAAYTAACNYMEINLYSHCKQPLKM